MTASGFTAVGARKHKSRITNGSKLLPTVHPQSVWGRILRDTLDALTAHLGGASNVSEPRRLASRRASALEAELIHLENKFGTIRTAGGEPAPADLALYCTLANAQKRALELVGLDRVPRPIESIVELMAAEANRDAA
jgi:hypothetical protein